ncbi:modification methylase [Oleiphilus messinensis]|uniref:site-specific DNA-methyltransferase (adenine-specific) n=2 Tax=Oleiphilus messinensis TaxID=141451 RepID=A0A1Y0I5P8_9GAMM|nr:modification methylase [Oleiphilus messinensis]
MVGLLDLTESCQLLEPCAGDGAFIDQIITQGFHGEMHLFDLNPESIEKLKEKYKPFNNIKIDVDDFVFQITSEKYDRIIANPPYGAYQTPEKRKQLKKNYPTVYAKETYGVFLMRALEMLKEGGKLVFIIPDTYLTLHMHEGLRSELVKNYTIDSITLFPSNFFPGVNFGYAGLSIIEITNRKPHADHSFKVYEGLSHQEDLPKILESPENFESYNLTYADILKTPSNAFLSKKDEWVTIALNNCGESIGDICNVVTGFYSGNDGKFLRRSKTVTRGLKKYQQVVEDEVCKKKLSDIKPLDGIDNGECWVPIVKGGNRRFYKPSEWFMDWSFEAIHNYKVENKKRARFQNSQFYFCHGIGVPMVSSSSITGAMIDGRLFDQSIVGIFPKKEHEGLLVYLLGFFNSSVCNTLIRTINASTNNSSNYIKKLPIIIPERHLLNEIERVVNRLLDKAESFEIKDEDLIEMNRIFNDIYSVPRSA